MTADFPELPPAVADAAAESLDEADAALLTEVRGMYDAADPVPPGLVDRLRFGLALDEVFEEVAAITRAPADPMAVRGEPAARDAQTRTETLTFSAERLTAMVTVTRAPDGTLRMDGWVAPPGPVEVRLRTRGGRRQVVADESGRFVVEGLSDGFVQLSFHPAGSPESEGVIVTPLFQL